MVNRRNFLAVGALGGAATLSGCLGFITGSEPAEFSASPARVPDATLNDTGYALDEVDDIVIEEEFEAVGMSREVIVTNYNASYQKTVDVGPIGQHEAAVFTALTTPKAEVLGREFNPVAEMSSQELAELVQDHYDGFDELEHVEDDSTTVNDQETTVSTFRTEATLSEVNQDVEIYVMVTEAVDLDDDLVVTIGAYPQLIDEEANVRQMMATVEPDS